MELAVEYPHVPKSTRTLRPGQFWAVPLSNGMYACGRVVQLGGDQIPTTTRAFFGGLHDWVGTARPTEEAIAGAQILAWGVMHIKAITELGGAILGLRPLDLDSIEPPILVSGQDLLQGAVYLRPARPDEVKTYPPFGYWGYDFIQQVAEHRLVAKSTDR